MAKEKVKDEGKSPVPVEREAVPLTRNSQVGNLITWKGAQGKVIDKIKGGFLISFPDGDRPVIF